MSENQGTTKGVILTLDSDGKAHYQFLGNITEVECMGLGHFLLTLPERKASGTLLQTMATLIEVNKRLTDVAAEKTGRESMWEGLVLGIITFVGFTAIFHKAPRPIKWFIKKFPFFSDLLISVGAFLLLGNISGSFASAVGSGVAGILFSIYLWYEGNKSKWQTTLSAQTLSQTSPPK